MEDPTTCGAGGGVAVLWRLIFFAQLTVHCKAAAIKRQEHELSLAPQPAAVAEARPAVTLIKSRSVFSSCFPKRQ